MPALFWFIRMQLAWYQLFNPVDDTGDVARVVNAVGSIGFYYNGVTFEEGIGVLIDAHGHLTGDYGADLIVFVGQPQPVEFTVWGDSHIHICCGIGAEIHRFATDGVFFIDGNLTIVFAYDNFF